MLRQLLFTGKVALAEVFSLILSVVCLENLSKELFLSARSDEVVGCVWGLCCSKWANEFSKLSLPSNKLSIDDNGSEGRGPHLDGINSNGCQSHYLSLLNTASDNVASIAWPSSFTASVLASIKCLKMFCWHSKIHSALDVAQFKLLFFFFFFFRCTAKPVHTSLKIYGWHRNVVSLSFLMRCLFVSQDGLRRLSGNEYIFSTKRKFTSIVGALNELWNYHLYYEQWNSDFNFPPSCMSLPTEPHHIPSNLITPLSLNDIPPRIAQTMENEDSWDFDIFNLEAATMKR